MQIKQNYMCSMRESQGESRGACSPERKGVTVEVSLLHLRFLKILLRLTRQFNFEQVLDVDSGWPREMRCVLKCLKRLNLV